MNSVILLSSARGDGNTSKVVDYLASNKEDTVSVINILDYHIDPYNYNHDYSEADNYYLLVERLLTYDHIIFATPVYWYSMSAQLKIFFDRITDLLKVKKELGRQLRGKTLSLISVSGDDELISSFNDPFKNSADYLGMHYGHELHVWADDGVLDEEVQARLDQLKKLL